MRWRWYGYAAIASVVVLVAADFAYWNWAANQMRDGIRQWIAERTAEGWRIETGKMTIGGWPNVVVARLPDVRIAYDPGKPQGQRPSQSLGQRPSQSLGQRPSQSQGQRPSQSQGQLPFPVRLVSQEITLTVSLFQPTTLHVALHGEQRAEAAGAPPMILTAGRLEADLSLTDMSDRSATLSGRDIRIGPAAKTWSARIDAADGKAGVVNASNAPPALAFSGSADTVELPVNFKYPLGPSIHAVSVSGTLNGPFPPGGNLAASATAWRDGGGSLEVKQADVEWGPLKLISSATLALDDQLQPMGSGSAKVSGYETALDRLAAAGVLTKSAATVAKAMLSLLAGTGTGDAPSEVDVPLTLQYRTLSMRQVPLVRFPELDWTSP